MSRARRKATVNTKLLTSPYYLTIVTLLDIGIYVGDYKEDGIQALETLCQFHSAREQLLHRMQAFNGHGVTL